MILQKSIFIVIFMNYTSLYERRHKAKAILKEGIATNPGQTTQSLLTTLILTHKDSPCIAYLKCLILDIHIYSLYKDCPLFYHHYYN